MKKLFLTTLLLLPLLLYARTARIEHIPSALIYTNQIGSEAWDFTSIIHNYPSDRIFYQVKQ